MPDTGFLFLSLVAVFMGTLLILFPRALSRVSKSVNHTLVVMDEVLLKHRYVMGVLAFAASYAFFKIALMLPMMK